MLHEVVGIALAAGGAGTLIGATLGFYAAASAHEKAMRREARAAATLAPEPPHIRIPNPPTPPALQFFDQDDDEETTR